MELKIRKVKKNKMPFKSSAQRAFLYANHPDIAKRWSKEFPNQGKLPVHVKKKKYKIVVNNKLKGGLGAMNPKNNRIEINVKKHKGDRAELASTIKHEMLHVKHPNMTEKQVYKKSAKTKLSPAEQSKMVAKLRMKKINYKSGAVKRKFKMGKVTAKPGDMFNKMKESKSTINSNKSTISKTKLSIMGLV